MDKRIYADRLGRSDMDRGQVKIVRCKDCVNYDGHYCRNTNNVSFRFEEYCGHKTKKWKIHDVAVEEDDYCSLGEEGDYEPWGFPRENERLRK